jgi:hypothetical protein
MKINIFEAKKVVQKFSYSTIHLSFCNVDFGVIRQKDSHHSETNFLKVFANLLNCHLKNSRKNVSCLV